MMDSLFQDLRFALRTLRQDRIFTLVAIVSLALAIAGNAAVFSLLNAMVLRPMPYPDIDEIVALGERTANAPAEGLPTVLPANYLDLVEHQGTLRDVAAFWGAALSLDTGDDTPRQLVGATVTPGFFALFGVKTIHGRPFTEAEGVPGNERVAVLSKRFWIEHYGGAEDGGTGDPTGEILRLNGEAYEVVGVVDEFELFLSPRCQVWLPMALDRATARRSGRGVFAFGRLANNTGLAAAQAEISALVQQLADEHPENRGRVGRLLRLSEQVPDGDTRLALATTQGALLLVLLIACANLANLLLARTQRRQREIALRAAVGATRGRIARQLLTESLVLAGLAGLLGIALGAAALHVLAAVLAAQLPSWMLPVLDPGVLLFSLAVTLLSGLLFGLAPMLRTARTDLLSALKDGTPAAGAGNRRRLAANVLVVAQVALALVFLAGAIVLLEGFQQIRAADAGFRTGHAVVMIVRLPERFDTPETRAAGLREIVERLSHLPGAEAATAANLSPRLARVPRTPFLVDGRPPTDGPPPEVDWLAVYHGFFEAFGIPVHEGRSFAPSDTDGSSAVAIVNQAAARRHWPDDGAVGQRITVQGTSREVVGVVGDVRHGLFTTGPAPPAVYLPWTQQSTPLFRVLVTARDRPSGLVEPARREVLAFDPATSVTRVQTLEASLQRFFVGQQILSAIFGAFGLLALALAVLGVYGVLSYGVALRRHEIAVRMALGAGRRQVVGLVLRQGLNLALLGLAVGAPGAWGAVRLSAVVLSAMVPFNAAVVVAVAAVLLATAAAASVLPARRAATVDPARVLRE
jgi:putative ABC transport system permease protein